MNVLEKWDDFTRWADPWMCPGFRGLVEAFKDEWPDRAKASLFLLLGLQKSAQEDHRAALNNLARAVAFFGAGAPRQREAYAAYVEAACSLSDVDAIRTACKLTELFDMPCVSIWRIALFGWHDELIAGKRSDSGLLTNASGDIMDTLEAQQRKATLSSGEEFDWEDYDPASIILFRAHMLARHEGRVEDAEKCYGKVNVEAIAECPGALQSEYGKWLLKEKRYAQLASMLKSNFEAGFADRVEILASGEAITLLDTPLKPVLHELISNRAAMDRLSRPNHIALLAVLLAGQKVPDANVYADRALKLAEQAGAEVVNDVAWLFYRHRIYLREAVYFTRRARAIQPDNVYLLQTFVALLFRVGEWDEAVPEFKWWASTISADHLRFSWPSFLIMFRDAVSANRACALADALVEVGRADLFGDIGTALRMKGGFSEDRVLTQRVRELVAQFAGRVEAGTALPKDI